MKMTMLMILNSIVIEVIRTVFIYFFMKDILSVKNTKNHLRNIQPDISKQKKKHLSNIQSDNIHKQIYS